MKSLDGFPRHVRCLIIAALWLVAAPAHPAAAQAPPDGLDGFEAEIEQVMEDWSVPGLAIGIVTDTSVVWTTGFGERDVEAGAPVTEATLFAIGSTTKAFTAAGLGILHDEGQVEWSTPVREYVPRFKMHDAFATEEMTPIDLLTHRSGLPRHDLLWYATDYSRESLFERLRHLAPSASFRSTFQYQNLMYMTAGYLVGQVSGTTWEDFTRRRLLDPLGMTRSTFSVTTMQEADDYARPYGGGKDSIALVDYRNLDAIGPAGSINASVSELTAWVQLMLNDGQHEGTPLIDSTTVAELTRPRIVLEDMRSFMPSEGAGLLYALGWFVETRGGHRVLWHSGGIDGFSAMVGMIPEREIGWIILTNKGGTPTPSILMYELIDRILEREGPDWSQRIAGIYEQQTSPDTSQAEASEEEPGTTAPPHPLDAYAGRYLHPGYGAVEIAMQGDSLAGRYGTFSGAIRHDRYTVFEWHPEVGGSEQTFKINFRTAMDGSVDEVVIPMEPAVDPIVFTRTASEELGGAEYLSQFAGEYAFQGQTLTVRLRGDDTLTLTVPGQPTYPLEPTDEDEFTIQNLPGFSVSFQRDGDAVTQMTLHQPNGTFQAERR